MGFKDFKLDIHGLPVVIGIGLLIVYIILSIFTGFSTVSGRFVALLIAFTKDFNMAYVLFPIYLGWFISDYYQERKGTDLGNAMANGFMGLWVGIDWVRNSYSKYTDSGDILFLIFKGLFAVGMLAYAAFIMGKAAQGQKIARYVGRIREVSYFAIVFTPIVYDVLPFDFLTIVAAILFFPVIYGIAEMVDFYILPASKAELAEESFQEEAKSAEEKV